MDTGVGQHNIFQLKKGAREAVRWLCSHMAFSSVFLIVFLCPLQDPTNMDVVPAWIRAAKPEDLSLTPGTHKGKERTHSSTRGIDQTAHPHHAQNK